MLPKKCQWVILLIGSYAFYFLAGGWKPFLYLLATTVTVFIGGRILGRIEGKKKKRALLLVIVIFNLLLLGAVKYADFVFEQLNLLFGAAGLSFALPLPKLLMPLGISFYTFQSVGYLIDVYRRRIEPDTNIFKFALFVSYFPQIVQGPISRYGQLAHQLYESHSFDYDRVRLGLMRMLWGFFRKLVIADRIAVVVNQIFDNYMTEGYTGFIVFLGAFLYGVQVYADFAGGMDIVLGISQIYGIEQVENFRQPFMAKSVAEFWRRWHITLGDWMREYVFYPLALSKPFNRMGKNLRRKFGSYVAKVVPTSIASLIVFILVGVWHGAAWNFVAYGLYQAAFISTDSLFKDGYKKLTGLCHIDRKSFSWNMFQMIRTTIIVTFGRYFSRAPGFMDAWYMLKATFRQFNPWVFFDGTLYNLGLSEKNFRLMILLIILLLVVDIIHERNLSIRQFLITHDAIVRWIFYFLALFGIIILGMYGSAFDSGKFIYQGF